MDGFGRLWGSRSSWARCLGTTALYSVLCIGGVAQAQSVVQRTHAVATAEYDFQVAPQPLASAIARFSSLTGIDVVAYGGLGKTLRSQGVEGRLSVEDALKRLLDKTGLSYHFSNETTVVLKRDDGLDARAQAVQLDPITVEANRLANDGVIGYVARRSGAGTKTNTPIIETPQSVSVVTREQMEQRSTQTIDEALRYSPGVAVAGKEDNRFDYASARGFALVQYLDGLKLGTGSFAASQTEPYFLERIDILLGPASTLYGRSTPGGIVDMTSKRPTATPFREILVQTGSFERKQAAIDLSGPLDKDGKLLGRITAVGRLADTQVDYVKNERFAIAPALTWRPNDDTSITLLTSYQNDPSGGLYGRLPAQGSIVPNPSLGTIPTSFFFGDRAFNSYHRTQYSVGYQFEHRFNDSLSFRQNARYRHVDLDYNFLYATTYLNPTTLRRNVIVDSEKLDTYAVDNQFEANVLTGPVAHKLLFGLDYYRNDWDYRNGVGAGPTISLTNPNYYQAVTAPAYTTNYKQYQEQFGLYVQDQIKFAGFILTLGGRQDEARTRQVNRINNTETSQSDRAFTGRAGLTYVFNNGVAPYVSYAESFEPTAGADFYGVAFKPTTGTQYEAGIKYQPTQFNALFTVAAFDIRQQNVLTADPDPSHGNAQVQTGEVRSRGYQGSVTASLAEGLNLVASYARLNNEVTKSNSGLAGTIPAGVPSDLASLWADYTFQGPTFAGLNIGAGVRRFGTTYGDSANTFAVPAYTLLDAKIQYELGGLAPSLKGLKLVVQLNNLLDQTYVAGCSTTTTCYYGYRRNVLATLSYRW